MFLIKRNKELQVIGVKLSIIRLVKRLVELENGIEWIIQWKIWTFFLNFNDDRVHTQITLREQASFIVDLLIKLEEQQQFKICQHIVESMITTLVDKAWFDSSKYSRHKFHILSFLLTL